MFPSFLKTPSNVVVKVGNTAKLECSATGFPLPKISWLKDGGTDFPAAQGKRMKIMNISPDEPFFIVNVRLEDAGVYTCTAKNTAGFVSSNASLSVLGMLSHHEFAVFLIIYIKKKNKWFNFIVDL